MFKAITFDIDRTLFNGSTLRYVVSVLKPQFLSEVDAIAKSNSPEFLKSVKFAKILKGLKVNDVRKILNTNLLEKDFITLIQDIKKLGLYVGVISIAYDALIKSLVRDLPIDFIEAVPLKVKRGVIAGEIYLSNKRREVPWCLLCPRCKRVMIEEVFTKYKIKPSEVIHVGDGLTDACLSYDVGHLIIFNPYSNEAKKYAKKVIENRNIKELRNYILKLLKT